MAITGRWSIRALMVVVALCALGLFIRKEIQDRAPVYREMKLLRTGTPAARRQAAIQLGMMGNKARMAEDTLTAALDDVDPGVREAATIALFKIGVKSPALVHALVQQLETPQKLPFRMTMVTVSPDNPVSILKAMKPAPSLLIPLLARALQNSDSMVRSDAFNVLADIAESADPPPTGLDDALLIVLADRRSGQREQAATLLAGLDSATRMKAVNLLVDDLSDLKSDRAPAALLLLAHFVPENEAAAGILRTHLRGSDELSRLLAIFALAHLPHVARLELSDIVEVMTAPDADRQIVPLFQHRLWETTQDNQRYHNNEANRFQNELPQFGPASVLNWSTAAVHRLGPEIEQAFVNALIERLNDPDEGRRGRMVSVLGSFGPMAAGAIPKLVEIAQSNAAQQPHSSDDDPDYPDEYPARTMVPAALGKIGAAGDARAVKALASLVNDPDSTTANNAAIAIDSLGPKAEAAIPELLKALTSPNVPVRRWASSALAKMSGARLTAEVPALLTALDDADDWVRVRATEALGNIPDKARPGLPKMIRLLHHLEPNHREGAVKALAKFGVVAQPAVPTLLTTIDDEPTWVHDGAEKTLDALVPNARLDDSRTIAQLSVSDSNRRFVAAVAIARAGTAAPDAAVPALRAATRDSNSLVRETAIVAIGRMGGDAAAAAPEVLAAFKNGSTAERLAAAYALGRLAPRSPEALPSLIEALKDQDDEVRQAAAVAIGKLGPSAEQAASALAAALKDQEPETRIAVVYALGRIGPAGGVTVPALTDALNDRSADVRFEAVSALSKIGSRSDSAITALLTALRNEEVAWSAGYHLGNQRSRAEHLVPELVRALKDPSPSCRIGAAYALGALGKPAIQPALPALIACLKDPKPRVRGAATFALQRFGGEAAPAEPALRPLLDDHNQWVRRGAADALHAIKEKAAPF